MRGLWGVSYWLLAILRLNVSIRPLLHFPSLPRLSFMRPNGRQDPPTLQNQPAAPIPLGSDKVECLSLVAQRPKAERFAARTSKPFFCRLWAFSCALAEIWTC